mgnify:CR=1 FL=1
MKSHILSIALVSLLFSITGFSQTLIQKETNIDTSDLHFLPSSTTDFNATAPFDARGFEPASFSSYSDLIETNYLLLNPTKPVK